MSLSWTAEPSQSHHLEFLGPSLGVATLLGRSKSEAPYVPFRLCAPPSVNLAALQLHVRVQCRLSPPSATLCAICRSLCEYKCRACGHSLASGHLLDLHLSESHDPFLEIQAAKRMKVFRCVVEVWLDSCGFVAAQILHLPTAPCFLLPTPFSTRQMGMSSSTSRLDCRLHNMPETTAACLDE